MDSTTICLLKLPLNALWTTTLSLPSLTAVAMEVIWKMYSLFTAELELCLVLNTPTWLEVIQGQAASLIHQESAMTLIESNLAME